MRVGLKNDWLQILAATSVWRLEEMSLKMNLGMGLKMHIGRKMLYFSSLTRLSSVPDESYVPPGITGQHNWPQSHLSLSTLPKNFSSSR